MPIRYQRPYSPSAHWSRRLAVLAVFIFAVAGIGHRLGTLETPNLVVIAFVAVAIAVMALLLALIGFARLWSDGAKGGRAAFWGMLFALVLIVPFAIAGWRYVSLPRIFDVSTDIAAVPALLEPPQTAPSWLARPAELPVAARFAQRAAYPELTSRRYDGAVDRVFAAVRLVAEQRGIAFVAAEGVTLPDIEDTRPLPDTPEIGPADAPAQTADPALIAGPVPIPSRRPSTMPVGVIETPMVVLQGEATSPIFGLTSDIVIRLIEEPETTRVDMRAISRHGDHDLGLNAWQIGGFLNALDAELLGIAPE